jgi:hypothetical protein
MQLIESILADASIVAAMRRDIHAHPELCFQEERTADLIAKALTEWGIPVHRGLGKTGVVGIVNNGNSSRAVGLRADIDALPMTEHNHFAHASTYPGKMHACGHDGHTAMLLSAAHYLATHRHFDGTVLTGPGQRIHPAGAVLGAARRHRVQVRMEGVRPVHRAAGDHHAVRAQPGHPAAGIRCRRQSQDSNDSQQRRQQADNGSFGHIQSFPIFPAMMAGRLFADA